MKKLIILCVFALSALCCAKSDYDLFSGSGATRNRTGESYIRRLADDLVVDNLIAIEDALGHDRSSASLSDKGSYKTGGLSLWTTGSTWTVDSYRNLRGLVIEKTASDSTWVIRREGDLELGGETYSTSYRITVHMRPAPLREGHYDWDVVLSGKRTERKGYSCDFWSQDKLVYQTRGLSYWDTLTGTLFMEVSKNGEFVDKARIDYFGSPADYNYYREL